MPRIHVIGRKNSGKTTLIVELVERLTARGFRVGTVKHTHHHHELDTPGKDSFRHRQAGAAAVGILAPAMNAVFWPTDNRPEGEHPYARFDALLNDCDLVLVEGHSQVEGIKIEVWRPQLSDSSERELPYAAQDPTVRAVVSDDTVPCDTERWSRSDVDEIVNKILQLANLVR